MTIHRRALPETHPVDAMGNGKATPSDPAPAIWRRHRRTLVVAGVVAVVVVGTALRSWAFTPLWLDEAQTVAIARLPLDQLFVALRQDGSPPLYYLMLHAWMLAFGQSNLAVRGLAAVCSVATYPLLWDLVRRLSGRRSTAWIALLLFAASPFAIRYATECRMYAFVMLLTVLFGHALLSLRRRGPLPVLAVAAVTATLAFTHYWTLFLLLIVGGIMAWLALRRRGQEVGLAARRGLVGLALGAIPFLPWLPSFVYQMQHTGAPWADPAWFNSVGGAVSAWSGGGLPGQLLGFLYLVCAGFAVFGRLERGRVVLRIPGRTRRGPVGLVVLAFAPITIGVALSHIVGSAYADRYSSIGLVAFLLVVAYGIAALPRRVKYSTVAVVAVFGLLAGVTEVTRDRTEAGKVAKAISARAQPGDVVVVCPDQLGPALSRLLPANRYRQIAYPTFGDPARVDWVDYKKRNRAADPPKFADRVSQVAGHHTVWYVYADGYRTLKYACSQLRSDLQERLGMPRTFVRPRDSVLEAETLIRFQNRP